MNYDVSAVKVYLFAAQKKKSICNELKKQKNRQTYTDIPHPAIKYLLLKQEKRLFQICYAKVNHLFQ